MPYVPTKRCTDLKKHEEHQWKEGPFARRCPGRTTDRLPSRNRRESARESRRYKPKKGNQ